MDLFSGYAQQTTKDVNKSVTYSKLITLKKENSSLALTVDNDSPMVVAAFHKPLSSVTQAHTAIIG